MVAWIERTPPPGFAGDVISEPDVFTDAEVFRLLGLEQPTAEPPIVDDASSTGLLPPIFVILAAAMAVAIVWRMRERGRRHATTASPPINTSPRRTDRRGGDSP